MNSTAAIQAWGGLRPPVSPQTIIQRTAEAFGFEPAHLIEHNNRPRVSLARHVAMHLIRCELHHSLHETASHFRRDHSTIVHGVRRVRHLIETSPAFRQHLLDLKRTLFPQ